MADKKLEVVLTGDSKRLEAALGRGEKKVHSFGVAGVAAGALIAGGLGLAVRDVVGDFMAGEKASAQTAAVIKSTGGAANVTQKQVEGLATAIRNKSGIDDGAIQSGENMLLTFTNIRNEAGKGNKVFTDATKILADMSVATGTDMNKSAIQLGKALNDPIKGVGALSRVGVTFTEQQKQQIAAMVKAGDTAGAQKIILGELQKEFGGSAEAAGKTLGGQLQILKGKLEDMGGVIVAFIIPYLIRFSAWAQEHVLPALQRVGEVLSTQVIPILQTLGGWIAAHLPLMTDLAAVIGVAAGAWLIYSTYVKIAAVSQAILNAVMALNPLGLVLIAIVALVAGIVLLYRHSETARQIIDAAFAGIKQAASVALGWITNTGIPLAIAAWNSAKPVIMALWAVVKAHFELIKAAIQTAVSVISALLHGNFSEAFDIAKAAVGKLLSKVTSVFSGIPGAIRDALPEIGSAALEAGKKVFSKVTSGIGDIAGWISGKLVAAANAAIDRINSALHISGSIDTHIPGVGRQGFDFNPPDIPHLAGGGIVTHPMYALIGEKGPEAVVPLGHGGWGGDIVFHQTPADADPQAIAAAISWARRTVSTA